MIIISILGYLFLSIFLLVLIALALFLFCPVRYYVNAVKNENQKFIFKFTWLFSLISFDCSYDNKDFKFNYSILWIKNSRKNNRKKNTSKKPLQNFGNDTKDKSDIIKKNKSKKQNEKNKSIKKKSKPNNKSKSSNNNIIISSLKSIYDYPDSKGLIKRLLKQVRALFKAFKFDLFKTSITFGFDDPYTTGITLGALCVFESMINADFRFKGDFEHKIFYIDTEIKGSFAAWNICKPIIAFLISDVIKYIKFIKIRRPL